MDIERILKVAVKGGASDVVLKTGSLPRFRFNGELISLKDGVEITPETMGNWIQIVVPALQRSKLESLQDIDFAFQSKNGDRFRVNLFRQRQTFGMVLRVVAGHIRTIEELQLPKIFSNFAYEKRGLILFTGATGSGKSTSMAAIIDKINAERAAHIITIEDPIEFNFKDKMSTINQREVGIDADSFPSALRSALRQNPDVILVGELRDKETVETALMAAETGHLVLSTLHTSDAVESLTRLMSYFPPHQHTAIRIMLAHTLRGIASQRLVARKDGRGLAAAIEVMVANAQIKELIEKGSSFDPIFDAIYSGGESYGMQTFDQALYDLHQAGIISADEAYKHASRKEDLRLRLAGVGR